MSIQNRLLDSLQDTLQNKTPSVAVGIGVLVLNLIYILAYIYWVPYPGFAYDGQLEIVSFATDCSPAPPEEEAWCRVNGDKLHIGDRLQKIGQLQDEDYHKNLFSVPFWGKQAGDTVPLLVDRDGETLAVSWEMQGPTELGRITRSAGILLFLPFWVAGTIVLLFFRPRNVRWYLLVLFNYLTACWVTIGAVSATHIWGAVLLTILLSWGLMPIYLHLHLLVPEPYIERPYRGRIYFLYGVAALMAGLQLSGVLPHSSHYWGMMLGIVGSLGLLVVRALHPSSPSVRAATGLMLVGVAVAFLPGVLLWLLPPLLGGGRPGKVVIGLITLAIPALPFFYFYSLYKHRLGDLEVRANRVLNLYSFLIVYATCFVLVFIFANRWAHLEPNVLTFALITSLICLMLALSIREPFQRGINQLAYGTTYEPERIVQTFANEIPRALNREHLVALLVNQVMPSLLIRQSALFLLSDTSRPLLYSDGVDLHISGWDEDNFQQLYEVSGQYLPVSSSHPPLLSELSSSDTELAWVRLIIIIEVDNRPLGIWFLGKRDPDDFYPQSDIELLQTLGNQIGVSLETTRLFEMLQRRANELEKAYLALRRADRLKDEFIRNISHELRTPLTAVSGYTDLLLAGDVGALTPEQSELLQIVADRSDDLIKMINDMITLQQTKLQQVSGQSVSLVEVAKASVQTTQLMVQKQGLRQEHLHQIVLKSDENIPPVWGDRNQLGQVFDNLLSNGVKFSPNGGVIEVQIRSKLHPLKPDGDDGATQPEETQPVVEVRIRDEGIGIPESELENIWEHFYQVDGSATRRFGGTGLGLALVRDIVESHQGEIWVQSEEGHGSTFTFVLPTLTTHSENGQTPAAPSPAMTSGHPASSRS